MKRVSGIGGIFFKAKDASCLQAWKKWHEEIDVQEWGGTTIWSVGPAADGPFEPGTANFMVNYRVEDVHKLVKLLKEEGCNVLNNVDESEYAKFVWVIDPEGNKVELWEPPGRQ